jgi:hypothetical protein
MFQKGNKLSPGGKRKGAGRKPMFEKKVSEAAEIIARKYIERYIKPVLKAYVSLAGGRWVKYRNKKTGKLLWTEFEADPATVRHYIERLIPAARQGVDIGMGTPEEFYKAIQEARRDRENEKQ